MSSPLRKLFCVVGSSAFSDKVNLNLTGIFHAFFNLLGDIPCKKNHLIVIDNLGLNHNSNFTACLEESNPGYHWDWDETKLRNLGVGMLVREREWEMDGNTGWSTECGTVTDVTAIREGKFKPLKDKPLKGKSTTTAPLTNPTPSDLIDDDEDIPF